MESFGTFARGEAADLMRISRSTLTFTLTYRAVTSLVEQKQRHMALVGIGVCAIIFISKSIAHFASSTKSRTFFAYLQLTAHLAQLTSEVATQFVSNLVAILLGTAFSEAIDLWWIILFALFGVCIVWYVTEDLKTA